MERIEQSPEAFSAGQDFVGILQACDKASNHLRREAPSSGHAGMRAVAEGTVIAGFSLLREAGMSDQVSRKMATPRCLGQRPN
ncbi:hypothetical protein F6R98_12605 [Candidatus Methylospira mobilis]|uniref:Uncharacterized protein n=1 Tax=Candidatus Methylospira mobilis TaxID=1808979 RepID=A0A5Q0BM83_9GAMM|nr:hypothetical protein [Candidatus Methylospira mobilis]QFY43351.1 hypothetical protein F6R98_12605 [Candidatus Methylospira mobilis]